MGPALLYIGAFLTAVWGVAHLVATPSVVTGFGSISTDNRRIITMEWVVEGVALVFIGLLAAAVTFIDRTAPVSHAVYGLSAAALLALALVSLFTGSRIAFLPFRLCPAIFTASAVLMLAGLFV